MGEFAGEFLQGPEGTEPAAKSPPAPDEQRGHAEKRNQEGRRVPKEEDEDPSPLIALIKPNSQTMDNCACAHQPTKTKVKARKANRKILKLPAERVSVFCRPRATARTARPAQRIEMSRTRLAQIEPSPMPSSDGGRSNNSFGKA